MSRTSFRVNPHSIVCLNVKELLARSRRHIWSLSDSNVNQTQNRLVRKRTLNHLAKLCIRITFLPQKRIFWVISNWHIWVLEFENNVLTPWNFNNVNFHAKIKTHIFGIKIAFFGYYWAAILKKLSSYLKSAPSNLSKY